MEPGLISFNDGFGKSIRTAFGKANENLAGETNNGFFFAQ